MTKIESIETLQEPIEILHVLLMNKINEDIGMRPSMRQNEPWVKMCLLSDQLIFCHTRNVIARLAFLINVLQ